MATITPNGAKAKKTSAAKPSAAALIIAGGRGTRFWPESRGDRPKPLFAIDGKTSLLAATIARSATFIPRERIFVLVSADQRKPFAQAIEGLIPAANLLVEPEARGTAVAIVYGCAVIGHRLGQDTVAAVMPADHHVAPVSAFKATLTAALALAREQQTIVIIGIPPTRPESGYGYMKIGRAAGHGAKQGFKADRFVEKPPLPTAQKMMRSGKFLWNAGMFVMPIRTLATELELHAPALGEAMRGFTRLKPRELARVYGQLEFDSFDRVVAEKAAGILGVRAGFRWHDVGSWEGLWEAMRGDGADVITGNALAIGSNGVLARGGDRLMVLLGVDDLVAVDAGDVVLIARRSRSQEIRGVIDELKRRGLSRYL
ncbi:MAG: sugar phosphate nucleotidyltransferase [Candidatus Binataceae bacterium]